jgi:hypothetical protein
MLKRIHPIAGVIGFLTILTFWISTIASDVSGSRHVVIEVKQAIPWGLLVLVPALAITAMTGIRMASGSRAPLTARKKRRMPVIAGNGLLILVPAAICLDILASHGAFGPLFYGVQALELAAGAINLTLMSLNIRDGLRLTGRTPPARARAARGQSRAR